MEPYPKIQRYYLKEIQTFCKTTRFRGTKLTRLGDIDYKPLEIIKETIYKKALIFTSLIAHVRPFVLLTKDLQQNMRLFAI